MRAIGYTCSVVGGREMNQDSVLCNDEKSLYAVADGVGGGLGGEIASKMAVDGLQKLADEPQKLKTVFEELQRQVLAYALETYGEAVMGTTLTAAMIKDGQVSVCHVGDSRCYLFSNDHLKMMTEDHEFFDESIQGTVLSSYLGIPAELHPLRVFEEKFSVAPGDSLLFCSDGLYRQMVEARIATLIREKQSTPEELVKTFCAEASTRAHSDNVTALFVKIE